MKQATITEVKNGLSAIIDRVRAGETVVVTDRGIPVARIEPASSNADAAGRLGRLTRAGLVRPASERPDPALVLTPGPAVTGKTSAVEAILDERRSDR